VSVSLKRTHYDIVVIGAGASGLFCASHAAQRGRKVLVIERANKVGKKILMSGGGRCNFTNHNVEIDNFVGQLPHFTQPALWQYSQWNFIDLVERYGIEYEERDLSKLFCIHSAKDILNMLINECQQSAVEIVTRCDLKKLQPHDGSDKKRYDVQLELNGREVEVSAYSVVVATGGLSIPTLGGSGIGYDIARQFGLKVEPLSAGLVPFMFSDAMKGVCERLSGLAMPAIVSCGDQQFHENILFTHRGLSGPAILQISNYWSPGDTINLNLAPEINMADELCRIKDQQGKSLLKNVLSAYMVKPLIAELQALWWPESSSKKLAEFSNKSLQIIGNKINAWQLKPSATEGYRTAEVTRGGVSTDGINPKTMEVNHQQGLYFIGEVLDVTGHLGGYNFQWAWSSGYVAGMSA